MEEPKILSAFEFYKRQNEEKSKKNRAKVTAQKKHKDSNVKKAPKESDDEEVPILVPPCIKRPSTSHNGLVIKKAQQAKKKIKIAQKNKLKIQVKIHKKKANNNSFVKDGSKLFKWLISPVNTNTFFTQFWEKECLHIEHKDAKYFRSILTTEVLDQILRDNHLYYDRNVNVVSYENGTKEQIEQEGRAVPSALWDFYSNGCSIRILNPQTYRKQIHVFIATLQEYFGTMVGANVYLTPPNSQGFAPHFDDIEAFIVQLEGRKHWKLYKPQDKDALTRFSSRDFTRDELGQPFWEKTLQAGDVLYMPRGTIHEGKTDSSQHSLHITFSVYQKTAFVDLLEVALPKALEKAAESNISFRKGLPIQFLQKLGHVNKDNKTTERQQIKKQVFDLLDKLWDFVDVDQAADELGRRFMYNAMPPVLFQEEVNVTSQGDGDFLKEGQVHNRVEISLDTKIRLLRYHCLRVVVDSSSAKIYYCTENAKTYHGEEEQVLDLDLELVPAIKSLQNRYPAYVEVEELSCSDNVGKLQLISDLWERGLIVTEEQLACFDE